MSVLETDHLVLRPPGEEDIAFFAASLADYDIARNLATAPAPYTEADATAFVAAAAHARAMGEGWVYTILSKATGSPVGCCGLSLKDGHYELGYWIAKPYWGRGFATEAARRLLAFAFAVVRAETVEAGWFHDNPASGRVLARLGFVADHVESSPCRARGEPVLCNRTMLTRERFGRKRAA
jgi:[ribosomal protein S5]-alanine N-acetyltransferase